MPLALKIVAGFFATIGVVTVALALWLWLSARPVFDEAQRLYSEIPTEARCESPYMPPPGYPHSAREVETLSAAEHQVYLASCRAGDMLSSCVWMRGAGRWAGYRLYRGAYLSDCQLRAISLHGDTPLHRSLNLLYPDRSPATLDEPELTCVAMAMRSSGRSCGRYPECCPGATH